jgi:hypothetical protein
MANSHQVLLHLCPASGLLKYMPSTEGRDCGETGMKSKYNSARWSWQSTPRRVLCN